MSPSFSDTLRVSMDLRGVSGDSLVLRAHAARELFTPGQVTVTSPVGAPPAARLEFAAVGTAARPVEVARVVLRGPLPREVRVAYSVAVNHRSGDAHVGFAGSARGDLGPTFGLITGRNVFLVPEPASGLREADVTFVLPPRWSAVAPWRRAEGRWRVGIEGRNVAEDLVAAAVGLGRFDERSMRVGGTRFTFAFEAGLAETEKDILAERLGRVAGRLGRCFPRGLGGEYLTIVVPPAPSGDEIVGDGWARGQGGTLWPLTPGHVRRFAERLLDAYLVHEPYRTELRRKEDYWLVDGLRGLYAWRAVGVAGLASEAAITWRLTSAYLNSLEAMDAERDLEHAYAAGSDGRISRELVAPFAALYLDHRLREASHGKRNLDDVVRRLFRSRTAPSFWEAVAATAPGDWATVRRRYVQGREVFPVDRLTPLDPTVPGPGPSHGPAVRRVVLAYTGDSFGFLETCGCEVNQSGGVARRATVLDLLRRSEPLVLLDAGSAFPQPRDGQAPDELGIREQEFYGASMDLMKYDAAAVGTTELAYGVDCFRSTTRGLATPYLSSNVRARGGRLGSGSALITRGPLRIGVIGVFEPPPGGDPLYERHMMEVVIEDPVTALRREAVALRSRAHLVVALGRLTPSTIRRVARECPQVDVVISNESTAPRREMLEGEATLLRDDPPGFVGKLLVLYTALRQYGLQAADLSLDAEGGVVSAMIQDHWLDDRVPDEPRMRRALDRFYDRMGTAGAGVRPPFAGDSERMTGRYVGAARCGPCHAAELAQWEGTAHARAFKTLLDRHRQYQPRCVSCHVVGFGTARGYRLGAGETLAGVQCEACHGPGGRHVETPSRDNIRRAVPEPVCLECHDSEHSSRFVYDARLPRVRHLGSTSEIATAGGAAGAGPVAIDPRPAATNEGREK